MNFPFDPAWYTPENLMSGTVAYNTLKAEYTRLRKNANKRLRNLNRYAGGRFAETRTAEKIRDALDIKPFGEFYLSLTDDEGNYLISYAEQFQTLPELNETVIFYSYNIRRGSLKEHSAIATRKRSACSTILQGRGYFFS